MHYLLCCCCNTFSLKPLSFFSGRFGGEEQQEENRVHLGNAIMSFYSALIDLLGRCAPEMHVSCLVPNTPHLPNSLRRKEKQGWEIYYLYFLSLQLIQAGKGEALRIRAILRSLVPIEDLVGVISLSVQIPSFGKGRNLGKHIVFMKIGVFNQR